MRLRTNIILILAVVNIVGCKKNTTELNSITKKESIVRYAKGFSLEKYQGFSILTVKNPWPNAAKTYKYILKEKTTILPDSLLGATIVNVPVQRIVVTSTTHIPSLEMLGVENSLVGFPNLNYISSKKVRARIALGKVKELGSNQSLNTEAVIDLQPDVIIGYGVDKSNPTLENLEKSGLKVLFNGDWNEETPLGKAEWIKFFGAIYGKQKLSESVFTIIEKEYLNTVELAKKAKKTPAVMAGDMFQDKWYLPKGTSWGSQLLKQAKGNYLWYASTGTGSLALSFETVFDKAKDAEIWITSGQYKSLAEMKKANPHYEQFVAFKTKKVYSFVRKEKNGGILYYELAPNRPDLVIKDIVKILHPELLPDHRLYFFEQLK